MTRKRRQERIATSRLTLPLTALYGAVVALLAGAVQQGLWVQTACLFIATETIAMLNNHYSLTRVYSRMLSCTYLMLSAAVCFRGTNTNESIQLAAVKTASKSRELSKSARRTIRYETANSFVCNIALPGKNIPVPAATAASIKRAGSGKSSAMPSGEKSFSVISAVKNVEARAAKPHRRAGRKTLLSKDALKAAARRKPIP